MALVDRRNRPPIVNRLYGGRLRITYRSDVINSVDTKAELLASVLLEPKTADSKHTECLIVSQDLAGGELNKPNTLIQVFETLTTAMVDEIQPITDTDVNARESITRTLIGQPDVDISAISIGSIYNSSYAATQIVNQSDEFRRQLKVKYLEVELSETQIGGDQRIDTENGRTAFVRTFVQLSAATYVPGDVGDISTIDSLSVALSDIKSETSGAVRTISRTYITAGKLSESTKDSSNGKLIVKSLVFFNEIPSTPSGFTLTDTSVKNPDGSPTYSYQFAKGVGRISTKESTRQKGQVKITSIQYLGADDATTPSGTLIDSDVTEKDGYVLTSKAYAEIIGTGVLVEDVQTKNGGKLLLYTRVRVGSEPTTPSPTIGGTVVLVDQSTKEEDGYTVYNRTFAEGIGEISRIIDYTQSVDQGSSGLTKTVIRHLTASSVTSDPTSLGGSVKIGEDKVDQEGYRLWTVSYAKGAGAVLSDTQIRNGGKLILYHLVQLGAPPTTPSPSIGGTVAETSGITSIREGYTVHDYRYAEGEGQISVEDGETSNGTILTRVIRALGTAPSTPEGYQLIETDEQEQDGTSLYTSSFVKGIDTSYQKWVDFVYPGRAKPLVLFVGSRTCVDIFLSPPVRTKVLATVEISYQTDGGLGNIPYALWNPTEWATMAAAWRGWDDYPRIKTEGLRGYRAENGYSNYSFSTSSGFSHTMFSDRVYHPTSGYVSVSGGPDAPDNQTLMVEPPRIEPAFRTANGTTYYRRTVSYSTIPEQTPLPGGQPQETTTGVTDAASLRAISTTGLSAGRRTNYFYLTYTSGSATFTQQVRGILVAGALASESTLNVRPNDYNGSTNAKYWRLTQ